MRTLWRLWVKRLVGVITIAMLLYLALGLWVGLTRVRETVSGFPVRTHLHGRLVANDGTIKARRAARGVPWR